MTAAPDSTEDLSLRPLHDLEASQYEWQTEKTTLIVEALRSLRPSGALADVGCHTGLATAAFRAAGFSRAVGFDINEPALSRLALRNIEARRWHAGNEPCPAADGEFEATVAGDIIEHVVDTDSFVDELRRVTAPGGHVVITTPNLAFWLSRIRLLLGKVPWSYPGASYTARSDIMVDPNHIRVTTRQEWQALFEARGLPVEDVRGWSMFHAIGGNPTRKALDRLLTRRPDLAFGLMFLLKKT